MISSNFNIERDEVTNVTSISANFNIQLTDELLQTQFNGDIDEAIRSFITNIRTNIIKLYDEQKYPITDERCKACTTDE